jgi:hypothetical protein
MKIARATTIKVNAAPALHTVTRTRAQLAAETKCARYLGASDGENLSADISWFTFFVAVE